jgi:PAS domain S-box-containing protein
MHRQELWPCDLGQELCVLGGIFYDAMQRKKVTQALTESEQRFRHTADHAPMMVWMSGVDGSCTYFNRGWLEFTGCKLQEQLGNGWTRCVHPEDVEESFSIYNSSLRARQRFEMEYRLRRHDNEYRWILDMGVPRFSAEGTFLGFIGSAIDITERKKAEAEMLGFGGKLINAQDEERRRIARDLHDDVGQRLALLAIGLDRLHQGLDPVPQQTVLGLLNQANEISECVRDLSHSLHSVGLDLLPLGAAMEALCREFPRRSSIAIEFFEQDVPPTLPQDLKLCFYRIAQEALQNIAKHSRAQAAVVSLVASAEKLFLTINDDGLGITLDQQSRTGLGLASMRERLRLVGGAMKITSAPLRGTTIEAWVPLRESSIETVAKAA